ncbi:MAG: DUF1194 domain-containing protein [Pseudomonadota bacterium]
MRLHTLLGAAVSAMALAATPAAAVPVDREIQLLIDVSGSVDDDEFILQRNGYVSAFRNPFIQQEIFGGTIGAIALDVIYWSGATEQSVVVDWALIDDADAANAVADAIEAFVRPFDGSTAPGSALNFGVSRFVDNGFESNDQVIDISGDGDRNDGTTDLTGARDAALNGDILDTVDGGSNGQIDRINGLPIINEVSNLDAYYASNLVGGTDSFTVVADDFETFQTALQTKLRSEILGTTPDDLPPLPSVPLPASMLLLMGGLGGLALLRQRTKATGQVA